jgi:hypothetical protein
LIENTNPPGATLQTPSDYFLAFAADVAAKHHQAQKTLRKSQNLSVRHFQLLQTPFHHLQLVQQLTITRHNTFFVKHKKSQCVIANFSTTAFGIRSRLSR